MRWDWAIDTFKVLLVSSITWVVIQSKKHAKPFVKTVKKFANLVETVELLQKEVSTMKSKQYGTYDILLDPLFILNLKGEVIYANTAYAKMGGVNDLKDVYGFGWMGIIPDEDREKMERQSKMFSEHPSPYEGVVRFKNRHTQAIIITECRTALYYENDVLVGTIGRLYILKN